ncbi:MAG TPA: DNA starvation/stationary phase protection protein [Cytophagaceae bacterium]
MKTATQNLIGLDTEKANDLAIRLNQLLANYQVFYQNLRGFHWNIKGKKFFELHAKFEELYTDAQEKIDEIAERILTLGHTPLHSFNSYSKISEISPVENITDATTTVETTLQNLSLIIRKEREILKEAAEADDEGTVTLLTDYVKQQEKTAWMLSAWLK